MSALVLEGDFNEIAGDSFLFLREMASDIKMVKDKVLPFSEFAEQMTDKVIPMIERHDEFIDKLFEQNDQRREEIQETKKEVNLLKCLVAQQNSEMEALRNRLDALNERQVQTEEKSELLQNTQHDEYDRAFKSDDFQRVFLFLITFGYNTLCGQTCVVFQEVNNVLCVCVNLRALNLIAKLKLNYSQVTKTERFPPFALFKLNRLRQLFREAKLPHLELDKTDVESLGKQLAMRQLKTPSGNKSSWIALEADPFVLAIQNLKRAKKLAPFFELFNKYYPKSVKPRKVTEKDMCYFNHCDDQPTSVKQPLFHTMYWKELFYPCMKEYRRRLNGDEESVETHAHFLSLYDVDYEEDIVSRSVMMQLETQQSLNRARQAEEAAGNEGLEEEEDDDALGWREREEASDSESGGEHVHKRRRVQ